VTPVSPVSGEEQSALELRALQRVIATGARALELDVVLDRCLEQALAVARADAGQIYLLDAKRKQHRLAASRNSLPEGTAAHEHEVVLMVEERRVGHLRLSFKSKPALADSTVRTLEAIGAFEAVAIESARRHGQAELRARIARTLNDCAERLLDPDADAPALILDTACRLVGGQGALLSTMFERDGAQFSRLDHAIGDDAKLVGMELPVTAPYLREAIANSTPTVVEDVELLDPTTTIGQIARKQATRAFILVTMRQAGRPVGQLFVKSSEPRIFAEAEIDGIQLLASLGAQALARAKRQAAERVEHARTAAILEHLPVVVAVIDRKGSVLHINAAGREMARRTGANLLRDDWRQSLASIRLYDREGNLVPLEGGSLSRAFAGESSAEELTLETPSGERLHILSVTVPLREPDGRIETVLSSFQEITALRELSDAKDRFLSIASHELRSPITSLRATTSLLQLDPNALTDESRRTVLLSRIQRQIDRLSTLVERLLDTTRLNAGELPLELAEGDLTALCEDAVEHARLTDPEHRYVLDAPQAIPGAWDPARIEQVLTNLLSNACRYSPHRSEIVLRARLCGTNRAVVDVTDQGPGVSADQRERLFTAFYRGAAASRHKGGLGLGLYITREIVRRHGGTIAVTSPPGQGATFTVELPLRPTT
jgi:signal transduction histidine kinase